MRPGDFPAILGNFPVLLSIHFDIYTFSFEAILKQFRLNNIEYLYYYIAIIVIISLEVLKNSWVSQRRIPESINSRCKIIQIILHLELKYQALLKNLSLLFNRNNPIRIMVRLIWQHIWFQRFCTPAIDTSQTLLKTVYIYINLFPRS